MVSCVTVSGVLRVEEPQARPTVRAHRLRIGLTVTGQGVWPSPWNSPDETVGEETDTVGRPTAHLGYALLARSLNYP